MLRIIGLGSLLSEDSARRTCPSIQNFRLVKLSGYRRVFNKTDSDFVKNNKMPVNHRKYACLSAIPCNLGIEMFVSTFDIPDSEWIPFVKREFEYKLIQVPFTDVNGEIGEGILCVGDFNNDDECAVVCESDPYRKPLWEGYKSLCNEPMWRRDILPDTDYLVKCLKVAQSHGDDVYNNFVQTTYIGDVSQTIEEYLETNDLFS